MSLEIDVAIRHRPMPGEEKCGDRALSWVDGNMHLIAVIDGLGHGPLAALAADAAATYLHEQRKLELTALFAGCDRALRNTRGAMLTVVRIDQSTGRAWHAAIGNVEARLVGPGDVPLLTTPGIVGARSRSVNVRSFELLPGSTLILHTDGISNHFPITQLHGRQARVIADELLREHAKDHDDAGCAVIVS